MNNLFWPIAQGVIQFTEACGLVDGMVSKVGLGVGSEAIQKIDLWANVVTNEATSGADLIVPPGGESGAGQSAKAWK